VALWQFPGHRLMRQFISILFLTAAMLPAARAADPPPKLDSAPKGIEGHYNKTKTVQVDFVQTYTDRARKTTEKSQEDRREAWADREAE